VIVEAENRGQPEKPPQPTGSRKAEGPDTKTPPTPLPPSFLATNTRVTHLLHLPPPHHVPCAPLSPSTNRRCAV
jgi:hypothetical protein